MNRFEKKCFVGSVMLHGLLLAIVLFGAAFLSTPKFVEGPIVEMVSLPAMDKASGAPKATPTPVQPQPLRTETPPPKPVEPVKPPPETVKPKEPVKPVAKDKEPVEKEVTKDGVIPTKPAITKTVVRRTNEVALQLAKAEQAKRDRERREYQESVERYNEQRKQVAKDFGGIVNGVSKGLSHSTVVTSSGLDSSGGAVSGRYGDGLKGIYDARWVLNPDLYNDETAASVSVTVRRDGTVISAKMTRPSGNRSFDRSVQAVLDAVRSVQPFPPEMKDREREFSWKFERKTRLG